MDETIGKGATTLDWLKHIHPWLKDLLDVKDREMARQDVLIAEQAKRIKALEYDNDVLRRGGC